MSDAFRNSEKKRKWKKIGLMALAYTGVFAASAATAFFTTGQKVTVIDLRTEDQNNGGNSHLSKRERVIANMSDSVTAGLNISVTDFKFDQFYLDEFDEDNVKIKDAKTGHNTISNYQYLDESGKVAKAPIDISLKLDSLSLHGINLSLDAPLAYSNDGKDVKNRGVYAALLPDGGQETLYLNLFSNGNGDFTVDEEGNVASTRTEGGEWDFKYKIGVSPKEVAEITQLNGNTAGKDVFAENDPLNRYDEYFEYGELDWILSLILETLSEGAIDLSFSGWLDSLMGNDSSSQDSAESSLPTTSQEEDDTPGAISLSEIMDSMNKMVDVNADESDGGGYFIWTLPLGSKTLTLGLESDKNDMLSHVDLPAKYVANEKGEYIQNNEPWTIQDGMTLEVHADIEGVTTSTIDWSSKIRGEASQYENLADSSKLLREIASLAGKPEIGIDANLEIGHHVDEDTGTRTVLRKEKVDEAMVIGLKGKVDAYDNNQKKYALKGISADLAIDKKRAENEEFNGHKINIAYLDEGGDKSSYAGYVNVNDALLAKTKAGYIHELVTLIKETFSFSGGSLDISSFDRFLDILNINIKAIQESKLVDAIQTGSYANVLDFIESIESSYQEKEGDESGKVESNYLRINLNLAAIGIKGRIGVVINANDDRHGLAEIIFENVSFADFSINGSLAINALGSDSISVPEGEFQEMSHLKGIIGQVADIVNNKSLSAKVDGKLCDGEKTKLSIAANAILDFGNTKEVESTDENNEVTSESVPDKQGKVELTLEHPIGEKKERHNLTLGLQDDFKTIGFSYDTKALVNVGDEESPSYEAIDGYVSQSADSDALKGKLDLNAAKTAFAKEGDTGSGFDSDLLLEFLFGDDRFGRLSSALFAQESGSLLGELTSGKFFGLLDNKNIITSVEILSSSTEIEIDGAKLGMEKTTIKVSLVYGDENDPANIVFNGEKAIKDIKVEITKDNAETFDLSISDIRALSDTEKTSAKAFNDFSEGFVDFTPMVDMAAELANTITMGMYLDDKNQLNGKSNYNLSGDVELNIAGYQTSLYDFSIAAAVEGAETKIAANFEDLPVIRGVNAPDDERYFRPNELEGIRDSHIYFYGNGVDPEGELLLTRDSSYGRIKNVRDAVRIGGKDYTNDFLNWILKYSIGVNESLLDGEESTANRTQNENTSTDAEGSESSWNPFANGIHLAEVWSAMSGEESFRKESSAQGGTNYILELDLGKLLNIGLLGNATIVLTSTNLTQDGYKARCLTGISIEAEALFRASNSNHKAYVASAGVNLGLDNFGLADEDGYHTLTSVLGEDTDYFKLFLGNVKDDGFIDDNAKGIFYGLKDGFQSDDPEEDGILYTTYGYDLLRENKEENVIETMNFKGRNLYL